MEHLEHGGAGILKWRSEELKFLMLETWGRPY